MFNFNKEKDMENNVINNNEVVDMNEIIRIQKEYELDIDGIPLVDFNMTVGEYWDRYGGDEYGYGPLEKDFEIELCGNSKFRFMEQISGCTTIDIRKYDDEWYKEGECEKEDIGQIAIVADDGWYEKYEDNYPLRDALCEIILDAESLLPDDWDKDYYEGWDEW